MTTTNTIGYESNGTAVPIAPAADAGIDTPHHRKSWWERNAQTIRRDALTFNSGGDYPGIMGALSEYHAWATGIAKDQHLARLPKMFLKPDLGAKDSATGLVRDDGASKTEINANHLTSGLSASARKQTIANEVRSTGRPVFSDHLANFEELPQATQNAFNSTAGGKIKKRKISDHTLVLRLSLWIPRIRGIRRLSGGQCTFDWDVKRLRADILEPDAISVRSYGRALRLLESELREELAIAQTRLAQPKRLRAALSVDHGLSWIHAVAAAAIAAGIIIAGLHGVHLSQLP